MRKKGSNQQKAADRLFTQGRSVREVAKKLRISSSWAGTLRQRWHDSMSPAPVAPPPGRPATPAPPGPAQSTDKDVLADPKIRRDVQAMLAWANKSRLSEITFSEIYRWTREICPNSEHRNSLFALWSDTQTYEKLMHDNLDYYQGLEPENVVAVERQGAVAATATPDEQSKEDFSAAKLAAEVARRAQQSADEVIRRYTIFRMAGDIKNLELIAANELKLFTEAQAAQAKECLLLPAYKPEYQK